MAKLDLFTEKKMQKCNNATMQIWSSRGSKEVAEKSIKVEASE